jgi:hypothetical protein
MHLRFNLFYFYTQMYDNQISYSIFLHIFFTIRTDNLFSVILSEQHGFISVYKPLHVKLSEYRNSIFFDYMSRTELQNFSGIKIDQIVVMTYCNNAAADRVLKPCKK